MEQEQQQPTLTEALATLDIFEFFGCGGIRRHPEEADFVAAMAVIREHISRSTEA